MTVGRQGQLSTSDCETYYYEEIDSKERELVKRFSFKTSDINLLRIQAVPAAETRVQDVAFNSRF